MRSFGLLKDPPYRVGEVDGGEVRLLVMAGSTDQDRPAASGPASVGVAGLVAEHPTPREFNPKFLGSGEQHARCRLSPWVLARVALDGAIGVVGAEVEREGDLLAEERTDSPVHAIDVRLLVSAARHAALVGYDHQHVPMSVQACEPCTYALEQHDLVWIAQIAVVGDQGVVPIEEDGFLHGGGRGYSRRGRGRVDPDRMPHLDVEQAMQTGDSENGALGILAGGGPAPGINAVIAAATIRARLHGSRVLGIRNGFEELMKSDGDPVRALDIHDVSRIHFRGGSALGTSRSNPTRSTADLDRVVESLRGLGIDRLITIGGDDTAFSASRVAEHAAGAIRIAHVPKTIDNDLGLPPAVDTFGYQTARSVGVQILQNLMVDAKTTSRWYIVVAMGRKAGHLALGIGKAAGATLSIVPEEFGEHAITIDRLTDTIAGSIIKRRADGRHDGVVILAEGLMLGIDPAELEQAGHVERDAHDHVRLAEIDLGDLVKKRLRSSLDAMGLDATVVSKNLGYELRCADPIPFDMEYCRDLGYCAAKFLLEGGSGALISMQGGHFVPIPFAELMDETTGRMQVRLVDVSSTRYAIARRYMIRLRRDDFEDPERLKSLAEASGLGVEAFQKRFEYVVDDELPPLVLR